MTQLRRAFTLVELLAALAAFGVLIALLAVSAPRSRHLASTQQSIANLKIYTTTVQSYGADHADRIASLTWFRPPYPTQFPDLAQFAANGDGVAAQAAQAVDIIRRRGREEYLTVPPLQTWIANLGYTHTVLVDYLGESLPAPWTIAPQDDARRQRADDPNWPTDFRELRSSYEISPVSYVPDTTTNGELTLSQGSTHAQFQVIGGSSFPQTSFWGNRSLAELRFPSSKAYAWEQFDRTDGNRPVFFGFREARVPVAAYDGSVIVRQTQSTNPGWGPANPNSVFRTIYVYDPNSFFLDPPAPPGVPTNNLRGHYRWTRRGLQGRDFDGPEAN